MESLSRLTGNEFLVDRFACQQVFEGMYFLLGVEVIFNVERQSLHDLCRCQPSQWKGNDSSPCCSLADGASGIRKPYSQRGTSKGVYS